MTYCTLCTFRTEVLNGSQKLILGMYAIYPAFGAISPGQTQTITVDCIADKAGVTQESLAVEISDLPRETPPMNYQITGEVLVPGIEASNVGLIFEEHRICKKLGALGQHMFREHECVGIYGEEDKKFIFKGVTVGRSSVARFRVANHNKVRGYRYLFFHINAKTTCPQTVFMQLTKTQVHIFFLVSWKSMR